MFTTYVLLVAALAPAIALMVYVYRQDKVEKEPAALVARVFIVGAFSGLAAAFVESFLFGVFEAVLPDGMLLVVVEYFIGVAAVEEACKYLALNTVRTHPAFDYVFDAIVYSVAAALGFAALENVFYVFDGGLDVAVTRALLSVPGHMADGVVMGVFFGLARKRELHGNAAGARSYYLLAYIVPVIEHGFYDTALSLDSNLFVLAAIVVDIAFIAIAFLLVRSVAKYDAPLHPQAPQPQLFQLQQQPLQQPMQQPVDGVPEAPTRYGNGPTTRYSSQQPPKR